MSKAVADNTTRVPSATASVLRTLAILRKMTYRDLAVAIVTLKEGDEWHIRLRDDPHSGVTSLLSAARGNGIPVERIVTAASGTPGMGLRTEGKEYTAMQSN